MSGTFDERKSVRDKQWSSVLLKTDGSEVINHPLENSIRRIDDNLELLHELRLMAYPQLRDGYIMDRSIVNIIRP